MDLWKGKIAVVTGASSGIGAAIAVALSREGVNVIGLARRVERVEKLAEQNASNPGKITAHKCDVSDIESIKTTFTWIKVKFGRIDILINNAGIFRTGRILSKESLLPMVDVINTNLIGLMACTKEAFKLMQPTGDYGYIINIGSVASHQTTLDIDLPFNVYSGSKHAVRAVSDVLRHELIGLGNTKIRLSSVSPGAVATEISQAAGMPQMTEMVKTIPHLKSEDLADQVLFLLSRKPHIHVKDIIVQAVGEK